MKPRCIAVLGLGLMGGSLAAACKKKLPKTQIIGISRKKSALAYARRRGWIDKGSSQVSDASAAELAVICTPVDVIPETLEILDSHASASIYVTDVGSVKGSVVKFADSRRWKKLRFMGAHPMVGSHLQGIEAAQSALYKNGLIFLTPGRRAEPETKKFIRSFWGLFSKRLIEISPERHDAIVSQISHLPHAAAACLMNSVLPANLKYAAKGFRDTTRVAASHPSVWLPIFLQNGPALGRDLGALERQIRQFRRLLKEKNAAGLQEFLKTSSRLRLEI